MVSNDVIRQEFAAIEEAGGRITPKAVVDAARPEDSPLHSEFTWDDSVAGEKWRLQQARHLILRIRVVTVHHQEQVRVPVYVRDPGRAPMEQGYQRVTVVSQDNDTRDQALLYEVRRALSALERARNLAIELHPGDQRLDDMVRDLTAFVAELEGDEPQTVEQETEQAG
jgi:hypothetical protein